MVMIMKEKKKTKPAAPTADRLAEKAMFHNPPASNNDLTGYVQALPDSTEDARHLSELCNLAVCAIDDDPDENLESEPR